MNKKGESAIGDVFIGIAIFIFVALGGFVFYTSTLVETGASTPSSIDFSALNASLNNLSSTAETIDNESIKTPAIAGLDILAMGWDSIKKTRSLIELTSQLKNWVRAETPLSILPSLFWTFLTIIITISVTFILIGAVWRYKMKK